MKSAYHVDHDVKKDKRITVDLLILILISSMVS